MHHSKVERRRRLSPNSVKEEEGEWRKITFSPVRECDEKEKEELHHQTIIPLQRLLQSKVPVALSGCSSSEDFNVGSNLKDFSLVPSCSSLNNIISHNFISSIEKNDLPNITKSSDASSSFQQNLKANEIKQPIMISNGVLYPPDSDEPVLKQRFPRCATVYVCGLPPKISELNIRQIFEQCGKIRSVRMSGLSFCHVYFDLKASADEAIKLSGYKIFVEDKTDSVYSSRIKDDSALSGKLHVFYASDRSGKVGSSTYRNPEQRDADYYYTNSRAFRLSKKLRSEDFLFAIPNLVAWLKNGMCKRENNKLFFSMVENLLEVHIERLKKEKTVVKRSHSAAQAPLHQKMNRISVQLDDICKVFELVKSKNIWRNFTKRQKRTIESCRHITMEIKKAHYKELIEERVEEEMDLSDQEGDVTESNPSEHQVIEKKVEVTTKLSEQEYSIEDSLDSYSEPRVFQEKIDNVNLSNQNGGGKELMDHSSDCQTEVLGTSLNPVNLSNEAQQKGDTISVTQHETRLMILISSFLIIHPSGASIESICNYLVKDEPLITTSYVESLLNKFNNLFKEEYLCSGKTLLKTWKFLGLT